MIPSANGLVVSAMLNHLEDPFDLYDPEALDVLAHQPDLLPDMTVESRSSASLDGVSMLDTPQDGRSSVSLAGTSMLRTPFDSRSPSSFGGRSMVFDTLCRPFDTGAVHWGPYSVDHLRSFANKQATTTYLLHETAAFMTGARPVLPSDERRQTLGFDHDTAVHEYFHSRNNPGILPPPRVSFSAHNWRPASGTFGLPMFLAEKDKLVHQLTRAFLDLTSIYDASLHPNLVAHYASILSRLRNRYIPKHASHIIDRAIRIHQSGPMGIQYKSPASSSSTSSRHSIPPPYSPDANLTFVQRTMLLILLVTHYKTAALHLIAMHKCGTPTTPATGTTLVEDVLVHMWSVLMVDRPDFKSRHWDEMPLWKLKKWVCQFESMGRVGTERRSFCEGRVLERREWMAWWPRYGVMRWD